MRTYEESEAVSADSSVAGRAKRLGVDSNALMYDLLLERNGRELLFAPAANYVDGDYEAA